MLSGYADENFDLRIVAGLRRHSMDVVTAQERGQRSTDDNILLATASVEGRLFLTSDTDLIAIHASWMANGQNHAGIIFVPQTKSVGHAVRHIVAYANRASAADTTNVLTYV